MRTSFHICRGIVAALLLTASAEAITPSWSYEHPRITSGEFQIRSACIMPVEGKLSKLGMKGHEGMAKESDAWSTTLQNIVESHLKLAGVTLLPAMDESGSGASNDELSQVLLHLQEQYDGIADKINKRPKDIGKSRFTLGDDVALLPCAAKSDVLVFVQGEGEVLTGGKKTFGLFVPGQPASSTSSLVLTIADSKTGEILAYARLMNDGKFVNDSEKAYGGALDKQFKKMRVGTTADELKKKR